MKMIIMVLTVLLAASVFVLEASKAHATSIDIYKIVYEDHEGDVLHTVYIAAGADLDELSHIEAPFREGYTFVGWSAELPSVMPEASLYFVPIYVQVVSVRHTM